jgi:hypothetical protein
MPLGNYAIEDWSELVMYTCIFPDAGGYLHGWQCFSIERITAHMLEAHGVAAVEDTGEE